MHTRIVQAVLCCPVLLILHPGSPSPHRPFKKRSLSPFAQLATGEKSLSLLTRFLLKN